MAVPKNLDKSTQLVDYLHPMKLKIYQVDAFTDKVFAGNPAAVCPLTEWLPEKTMQQIAAENNLAETAFIVHENDQFAIRWFTPTVEVDLCGHATLATAHVLFEHEGYSENIVRFHSHRSGPLTVKKESNLLTLNFPTDVLNEVTEFEHLTKGLNIAPVKALKGKTDYIFIYDKEEDIANMQPDFLEIGKVPARGFIITAPGNEVDFVSRFFGPQSGINEDPVTGSAHTSLIPYWSRRLGKNIMSAIQLSERKGWLHCKYLEDRVEISGKAQTYLIGEIFF